MWISTLPRNRGRHHNQQHKDMPVRNKVSWTAVRSVRDAKQVALVHSPDIVSLHQIIWQPPDKLTSGIVLVSGQPEGLPEYGLPAN